MLATPTSLVVALACALSTAASPQGSDGDLRARQSAARHDGAPPSRLVLQARNLVLDHAPEGWLVTDFIQVRSDEREAEANGTTSEGTAEPTLTYPLPRRARGAEVISGHAAHEAGVVRHGFLTVTRPLRSAEHLFVLRYGVSDPFIDFELPGTTDMVDVLIREPAPPAEIPGLTYRGTVELDEGPPFVHFSGDGFQEATLSIKEASGSSLPAAPSLAAALGFLLAGGGALAVGKGDGSRAGRGTRDRVFAIAKLAEALERDGRVTREERHALEARRRRWVREMHSRRESGGGSGGSAL